MKGPVFANLSSLGNLKYSALVFLSYTEVCRTSPQCVLDGLWRALKLQRLIIGSGQ